MKQLITVFALAFAACGVVHAADDAASAPKSKRVRQLTPEQMKADDCAGQAEAKPREDRQQFIRDCIAGKAPAAASGPKMKAQRVRTLTPEQKKSNECEAKAANMARDDRAAYIDKCMAGESAAAPAAPRTKPQRVKTLTPEQKKRDACETQSLTKPYDDRPKFMQECLAK